MNHVRPTDDEVEAVLDKIRNSDAAERIREYTSTRNGGPVVTYTVVEPDDVEVTETIPPTLWPDDELN